MPKNPPKAYKDINFLESDHARDVRIIAEYELINSRFEKHNISKFSPVLPCFRSAL